MYTKLISVLRFVMLLAFVAVLSGAGQGVSAQSETGTITGTVTSAETGAAIKDIIVWVYDVYSGSIFSDITDANGKYEVTGLEIGYHKYYIVEFFPSRVKYPDDVYRLANYAPEYYDNRLLMDFADYVTLTQNQPAAVINAALETGAQIKGRVLAGDTGKPLSGAGVVARPLSDVDIYWHFEDKTNEQGEFNITALPAGRYALYFYPYPPDNYQNGEYTNENGVNEISLTTAEVKEGIEVSLLKGPTAAISGQVTDDNDNPLSGISVTPIDSSGNHFYATATDSEGKYTTIGLPDGDYYLEFDSGPEYVSEYYDDKPVILYSYWEADTITIANGQPVSGINAKLSLNGTISGRVTDTQGNGMGNVTVEAYLLGTSKTYSTFTNSDGSYTLTGLCPGNYTVRFWTPDGNYITQYYKDTTRDDKAQQILVASGQTITDINAKLFKPSSISGVVTGEGSGPLEYAQVRLTGGDYGFSSTRITDKNGRFTFDQLTPGTYQITVDKSGCQDYLGDPYPNCTANRFKGGMYDPNGDGEPDEIILGVEVHFEANITLQRDSLIAGKVSDSEGNPLEKVSVTAYLYDSDYIESYSSYTDSAGEFTLITPAGRPFYVRYECSSSSCTDWDRNLISEYYDGVYLREDAKPVILAEGEWFEGANVQLEEAGAITGRVTSNGEPVEYGLTIVARLLATGEEFRPDMLYFSNGQYRLTNLPPGQYIVQFSKPFDGASAGCAPGLATQEKLVTVTGGSEQTINVAMEQAGGISGIVWDEANNSVSEIMVFAFDQDGKQVESTMIGIGGGSFQLGGLAPGQYRLLFTTDGYPYSRSDGGYYLPEYYNNQASLAEAGEVQVTACAYTGIDDVVLKQGAAISGRVVAADWEVGIPVEVSVYNASQKLIRQFTSSSSGNFTLGLDVGAYTLDFRPTGWAAKLFLPRSEKITINSLAQQHTLNITLPRAGQLRGRVLDETGQPVAGAEVFVYPAPGQLNAAAQAEKPVLTLRTGKDGRYIAGPLPPGSYYLRITGMAGGKRIEYTGQQVTVAAGQIASVKDVILQTEAHIFLPVVRR